MGKSRKRGRQEGDDGDKFLHRLQQPRGEKREFEGEPPKPPDETLPDVSVEGIEKMVSHEQENAAGAAASGEAQVRDAIRALEQVDTRPDTSEIARDARNAAQAAGNELIAEVATAAKKVESVEKEKFLRLVKELITQKGYSEGVARAYIKKNKGGLDAVEQELNQTKQSNALMKEAEEAGFDKGRARELVQSSDAAFVREKIQQYRAWEEKEKERREAVRLARVASQEIKVSPSPERKQQPPTKEEQRDRDKELRPLKEQYFELNKDIAPELVGQWWKVFQRGKSVEQIAQDIATLRAQRAKEKPADAAESADRLTSLLARQRGAKPSMGGKVEKTSGGTPIDSVPKTEKSLDLELNFALRTLASEKHPDINEDTVLSEKGEGLFGIFDGMGGHAAGDRASRLAKDYALESLRKLIPNESPEEIEQAMLQMLNEANLKTLEEASKDSRLKGMGTTASIIKIWESFDKKERKAIIGQIGDSRIYIEHADGSLEQLTTDDSFARATVKDPEELKRIIAMLDDLDGKKDEALAGLSLLEKACFNQRHRISQCLGYVGAKPRVHAVDLKEGDRLILISDGIHDNLTRKEITAILAKAKNSEEAAILLAQSAQERSRDEEHVRAKFDDMSVVVVEIGLRVQETEEEVSKPLVQDTERNQKFSKEPLTIEQATGVFMKKAELEKILADASKSEEKRAAARGELDFIKKELLARAIEARADMEYQSAYEWAKAAGKSEKDAAAYADKRRQGVYELGARISGLSEDLSPARAEKDGDNNLAEKTEEAARRDLERKAQAWYQKSYDGKRAEGLPDEVARAWALEAKKGFLDYSPEARKFREAFPDAEDLGGKIVDQAVESANTADGEAVQRRREEADRLYQKVFDQETRHNDLDPLRAHELAQKAKEDYLNEPRVEAERAAKRGVFVKEIQRRVAEEGSAVNWNEVRLQKINLDRARQEYIKAWKKYEKKIPALRDKIEKAHKKNKDLADLVRQGAELEEEVITSLNDYMGERSRYITDNVHRMVAEQRRFMDAKWKEKFAASPNAGILEKVVKGMRRFFVRTGATLAHGRKGKNRFAEKNFAGMSLDELEVNYFDLEMEASLQGKRPSSMKGYDKLQRAYAEALEKERAGTSSEYFHALLSRAPIEIQMLYSEGNKNLDPESIEGHTPEATSRPAQSQAQRSAPPPPTPPPDISRQNAPPQVTQPPRPNTTEQGRPPQGPNELAESVRKSKRNRNIRGAIVLAMLGAGFGSGVIQKGVRWGRAFVESRANAPEPKTTLPIGIKYGMASIDALDPEVSITSQKLPEDKPLEMVEMPGGPQETTEVESTTEESVVPIGTELEYRRFIREGIPYAPYGLYPRIENMKVSDFLAIFTEEKLLANRIVDEVGADFIKYLRDYYGGNEQRAFEGLVHFATTIRSLGPDGSEMNMTVRYYLRAWER